jgi:hypothetical protein
MLIGK